MVVDINFNHVVSQRQVNADAASGETCKITEPKAVTHACIADSKHVAHALINQFLRKVHIPTLDAGNLWGRNF